MIALKRKNLLATLLFSLPVICSAALIIANANFQGEWTFNEGKSKLGEGRFRMAAQSLKVTQDASGISIDRTSNSPQGQSFTSTDKLTFDGKEATGTAFGNSKKVSTTSWSSDGSALTIKSTISGERNGQTFELKTTEVWKLTDDKTLSIDYTSESARGTTNQTFVYDKK
jgi:hypothetical protein